MPNSHDAYAALKHRDYRRYAVGMMAQSLSGPMLDIAIGWELYERTQSKLALGFVGLTLFLPVLLLALPAGHLADRFDRHRIIQVGLTVQILISLALAWISHTEGPVPLVFVILFLMGCVNAILSPARWALVPQMVPPEILGNAITWNSSLSQACAITGPALGGFIIAANHSAVGVYLVRGLTALIFLWAVSGLNLHSAQRKLEPMTRGTLLAGLKFVRETRVILAAITMDMFAVLLGGAVMLLPVFAKDILKVGPEGLGWLRAMPSLGALLMAFVLSHRPPMRRAGPTLLWVVAGFGIATIVFGVSQSFWLSLAALFFTGVFDSVSVVIRGTLVPTRTPDHLRGRVSAVENVFIGTSNELGGFESGTVAHFFGPVASVVAGGVGTILVVLWVAFAFPEIRRLRTIAMEEPL